MLANVEVMDALSCHMQFTAVAKISKIYYKRLSADLNWMQFHTLLQPQQEGKRHLYRFE
jgi:hypothetical protein